MKPRNWTHTIVIAITAAAAIGCGNEAQNRIEDLIDQNEAGVAAQQAVLEEFEAELLEELQTRWGATEDNGCPDAGPRPEVTREIVGTGLARSRRGETGEVYAQRQLWQAERSKQSHCECVQKTASGAGQEVRDLEGLTFDEERQRIRELNDDELILQAAFLANTTIQFGKERADNRIARWKRVRDGTTEQPGWGVEGERRRFGYCEVF